MLSSRRIIIGHFMAIYKIQVWVEAQMSQVYTGTWTQVTFMCTGSFLKENDPIHEAELNKSCVNHHQQNWNTCSPQMSQTSLHTLVYMLCIFNTSEAISLHPATSSCSFREATQVRFRLNLCCSLSVTGWNTLDTLSLSASELVVSSSCLRSKLCNSEPDSKSHSFNVPSWWRSTLTLKLHSQSTSIKSNPSKCAFLLFWLVIFSNLIHMICSSVEYSVSKDTKQDIVSIKHIYDPSMTTLFFFNVDVEWSSWRTAHDR